MIIAVVLVIYCLISCAIAVEIANSILLNPEVLGWFIVILEDTDNLLQLLLIVIIHVEVVLKAVLKVLGIEIPLSFSTVAARITCLFVFIV